MNNNIQLVLKSSTAELPLNDKEYGIYLVPELEGLTGLPEIRTTSGVNSGYDGGWTSAQNYDARSITIRGVIANEDVATVERLRRALTTLAGQGKNEELTLDLVTEAGAAYTLQVHTIALEMAMQKVLKQQEFLLQLRADDPLVYDASETTHEAVIQVAKATGGFPINFEIPLAIDGGSEDTIVNNDGLERAPTITRLYGALHNPKIINHTTNQYMQLNTELGYSGGSWFNPTTPVEGKNISITDAPANAPVADYKIYGDTLQDGTPAPSAPVAVQTVTGNNTFNVTGKNLVNQSGEATDQFLNSSGGWSTDPNNLQYVNQKIPASGGESFTFSWESADSNAWIRVGEFKADGTFIQRTLLGSTQTPTHQTITTNSECAYIITSMNVGNVAGFVKPMFERGSTASDYEAYHGQSYDIDLTGRNLFDKNTATVLGGYYVSGSGAIGALADFHVIVAPCEPSTTYTIQWRKIEPNNQNRCRIASGSTEITPSSTGLTLLADNTSAYLSPITITTPANAHYLAMDIHGPSATTSISDILASLQIEKGSTATDYEAYWSYELCKFGTYQDYIYKSGGNWYVHKATGKARITTFDSASATQSIGNRFTFTIPAGALHPLNTGVGAGYSNMAKLIHAGGTWDNRNTWAFTNEGLVQLAATESMDLAQANTWLVSHPFYLYYPLTTPTDTEITNAALVAQLESFITQGYMLSPLSLISLVPSINTCQATLAMSYFTEQTEGYRDEVVIDSRMRTITLNGLDIYHLKTAGSEFLMLAPGENRLSLQSDITGDNGYAEVSYKQGYLSI